MLVPWVHGTNGTSSPRSEQPVIHINNDDNSKCCSLVQWLTLDQQRCSTPGPVITWMGDCGLKRSARGQKLKHIPALEHLSPSPPNPHSFTLVNGCLSTEWMPFLLPD